MLGPRISRVQIHAPTRRHVVLRSLPHDVEVASYFVGKGVILFTMFYCTLNWLHYKRKD